MRSAEHSAPPINRPILARSHAPAKKVSDTFFATYHPRSPEIAKKVGDTFFGWAPFSLGTFFAGRLLKLGLILGRGSGDSPADASATLPLPIYPFARAAVRCVAGCWLWQSVVSIVVTGSASFHSQSRRSAAG